MNKTVVNITQFCIYRFYLYKESVQEQNDIEKTPAIFIFKMADL